MDTAPEIRAEARAFLKSLSAGDVESASESISKRFLEMVSIPSGVRCVALYRPLQSEIKLAALESAFMAKGIHLCFPRLGAIAGEMEFHYADPRSPKDWFSNRFGILEPGPASKLVDPSELDLIIVPGLAFDLSCGRLGRGLGFYDRYLRRATRALRVSFTFDPLLYDTLPLQSWDERVHLVITPLKIARTDRALEWIEH